MDDSTDVKIKAEEFANANKKRLAKELTDTSKYSPDEIPISVFMAGSPGAGKTEYSKNLIHILERNKKHKVIRIDPDELRQLIPGYIGTNSYLFQGAVSIIAEKIHDRALKQQQTFLFDGTLSKYEKAVHNIRRSLEKRRPVFVFYIYQAPEVAWKFTAAREAVEGRNIPKSAFIQQFLESRLTIERIRKDFDERVTIFLLKKNFETHVVEDIVELLPGGSPIEQYLGLGYSKDDLENIL